MENKGGKEFSPIYQAFEKTAKKDAKKMHRSISANRDSEWVGDYLKWADLFGRSKADKEAVAAYQALQKEHDEPAKKLLTEARKAFQSRDRKAGYAKYQEIVEEYYAAKCYKRIKRTLENR